MRVIAGAPGRTSFDNLYLGHNIRLVEKVCVSTVGVLMYTYIKGMLPELFLNMFTATSDAYNYDTRQQAKKNCLFPSNQL